MSTITDSQADEMVGAFKPLTDLAEVPPVSTGLIFDEGTRRLVDPETGESFSLVRVTDEATLEAALYRRFAIARRRDAIKSRIEELQAEIASLNKREEWLAERENADIVRLAETLPDIASGKKQSVALKYGKVGFSTTRASTKIVDEIKALEWAKANAPDAVKVKESVLVSEIPDEAKAELPEEAFEFNPGGEKAWYVRAR